MNRGEFFKTLLGAIALPFLPKQPERINLYPQRMTEEEAFRHVEAMILSEREYKKVSGMYDPSLNRPVLTINHLPIRIKQIINEQRQRRDII